MRREGDRPVTKDDVLVIDIRGGKLGRVVWRDLSGRDYAPRCKIIETRNGDYVCDQCGEGDESVAQPGGECQWCRAEAAPEPAFAEEVGQR